MDTSQEQAQQVQQLQKIAPHLIQASEVLQCTSIELRQAIERELMENPALESIETATDRCADCDVPSSLCSSCPYADRRLSLIDSRTASSDGATEPTSAEPIFKEESDRESDYEPDPEPDYDLNPLLIMSDLTDQHVKDEVMEGAYDPLSFAQSAPSLRENLLSRLRSVSGSERLYRTCEFLVNSLDERGWLKIDRTEVMVSLSITEDVLDAAIEALQSCDPPGIGARDLRECLLLQLQQLDDDDSGNTIAKAIVQDYWDLLIQRRYTQLARKTRSSRAAVADAIRFIQQELSPAPASAYREPWNYKPESNAESVKPDVIIRRSAMGFEVEIAGADLPTLHINARYRRLFETMRSERRQSLAAVGGASHPAAYSAMRSTAAAKLSQQERKHIALYVERANLFLKNIQQRKKTIERITRCLIDLQLGFIETGSRSFLLPLTRTQLAFRTNLHESTVSRALLRKYVQLPTQDVVPFDMFFASAGSVKDTLAAFIAAEDPAMPLSDETLRLKLEEMGYTVARRTIVKYRESLRIPASFLRRTH